MTSHLIKECASGYGSFNKCIVQKLYAPEAGKYLLKNTNLKLTDLNSVHFDFYREQLLRKYRNQTEYINDEFRIDFERKQNN